MTTRVMRPPLFLIILCALLVAAPLPVRALETIAPEELTAGMTGYGLTVLSGSTVERFSVTYMGRLENALPGQDILLIRLDDEKFEHLGVMAGMSGSPIYFDDKLCGALSYGWQFAKDPIAGVTPIADMFALKEGLSSPAANDAGRSAMSSAGLTPLSTPVMVSGLSRAGLERLMEELGPYQFNMIPAGSTSTSIAAQNATIEPGSAVGVQLLRGDVDFTAIGTVTAVDEDGMVYAFGHPFMGSGSVAFPMTTAVIEALLPSYASSFKIGAPVAPVGAVTIDRQPGIAGQMGDEPKMIPMILTLTQNNITQNFRVEVIEDPLLTPILLDVAWQSLIQGQAWPQGQTTLSTALTVTLSDGRSFSVSDEVFGSYSPLEGWVTFPLQLLWMNPYESVSLERIEITAELMQERRSAVITGARLLNDRIPIGDPLRVEVMLHPFGEGPQSKIITLPLPESLPEGSYTLRVTPGRGYFAPGRVYPRSYDQAVAFLNSYERRDQLILEIPLSRPGIAVNGRALPALPAGIRSVMAGSPETGLQATTSYLRNICDQPWVLSGESFLNFQVIRESNTHDEQ